MEQKILPSTMTRRLRGRSTDEPEPELEPETPSTSVAEEDVEANSNTTTTNTEEADDSETKPKSKWKLVKNLAMVGRGLSSKALYHSHSESESRGVSTRNMWRTAPPSPHKKKHSFDDSNRDDSARSGGGGSTRNLWRNAPPSPSKKKPSLDDSNRDDSTRGGSTRNLWRNAPSSPSKERPSLADGQRQDSSNKGSTRSLWRTAPPLSPTKSGSKRGFDGSERDDSTNRGGSSSKLWRIKGGPSLPLDDSWSDSGTEESVDMYRDELDKALLDQIEKEDTEPQGDFDPSAQWISCWGRFWYEISPWQNWFLVEDPPYTQRTLDIPASFAPTGPWPVVGKMISLISGIVVLLWTFMVEENKMFCLAYLSTWNNIYFLVYMVCSVLNTTQGVSQPFSRVSGTVRVAWLFLAVTVQTGILEAIMYWGTEVDYDVEGGIDASFRVLMLHGGLTMEAILDGFTVNFIPLRWQQWWGCCLLPNLIYIGWTLVHAFFLWVGNPNEPDRNTIYKLISWRYAWKETMIWMIIAVFVLSPVIYMAMWMMSLYKWFCCWCWRRERRRYLQTTNNMEKYREMAAQHMAAAMTKTEERLAKDRERAEARAARRAARKKAKQSDVEDDDGDDVERGQRRRLAFFSRNKGKQSSSKSLTKAKTLD